MRWLILLSCFVATTSACGDNIEAGATLEVLAPARGTVESAAAVVVSGRALADAGVARVEINGVRAEIVASTGDFSATLALPPGTHLIETVAFSRDGASARDVRGISVGAFAGSVPLESGRIMQIGNDRLGLIANEIAATIDSAAIAAEVIASPVKDEGSVAGCDRDLVTVSSVSAPAALAMFGAGGGFRGEATYNPYAWSFAADYSDSGCALVSGTFAFDTEELHVDYLMNLAGETVELLDPSITYHHPFNLDEGTIEPAVVARVTDGITVDIANALMAASLPRIKARTDEWLASRAVDESIDVAGVEIAVSLAPEVDGSGRGMTIGFSSALSTGGFDGVFVSTPEEAPVLASRYAAVAISDDAVNQLLGLVWRAGGFDLTVDGISLELLVPPFVRAQEASAEILFADWMAREGDAAAALSARVGIGSDRTDDDLFLAVAEMEITSAELGSSSVAFEERVRSALEARVGEVLRVLSLPAAKYAWPAVEATPSAGYITIDTAR